MNYEINVARNGQHYFATAERSLTDRRKALEVFRDLSAHYPAEEGWKLSVSQHTTTERDITNTMEAGCDG